MYQNFMDYTDDACMVMFTKQQVLRMEAALVALRPSLLNSNACAPFLVKNFDAQLKAVIQPEQRICSNTFTPAVTIRNRGSQTLTSLNIHTIIDGGAINTYTWTGSLVTSATLDVTLNSLTTTTGNHILTVFISSPNNTQDEDRTSDTIASAFQYYLPVTRVSENFEGTSFPPPAWDIVNPDKSVSWKRITGVAKSGNASVMIDNFNYSATRNKDDLRLPNMTIPNVDSAFLSFNVAAAAYNPLNTPGNDWDTLEVLISIDCGQSYSSLYKKWGSSLVTRTTPATTIYVPAQNEWRKDSLDLANYINRENILIAVRNTGGNENAIYLDDINLRTVIVNPNLKSRGILVTPNPTDGNIAVQFYPPPANLKAIQVYSVTGQKITEVLVNGVAGNYYRLNLSNSAAGTYIVRVVFTDRVVTRKILKL
jgi:archaellum component FlaF (FlaF/FlaG flagellin family)